jgi:hypothetical protein
VYSATAPCSVDPNLGLVEASAAGTCTIVARQAGNGDWQAAESVPLTLPVGRATATIDAPSTIATPWNPANVYRLPIGTTPAGLALRAEPQDGACTANGLDVSRTAPAADVPSACLLRITATGNAGVDAPPPVNVKLDITTAGVSVGIGELTFQADPTRATVVVQETTGNANGMSLSGAGACGVDEQDVVSGSGSWTFHLTLFRPAAGVEVSNTQNRDLNVPAA